MQEIAMMNATVASVGSSAGRTAARGDEQGFGRVFAQKQQTGSQPTEKLVREKRAMSQSQLQREGGTNPSVKSDLTGQSTAADQVQQTLVKLLKAIAAGQQDGEEGVGSLAESLVDQLETTDLHGEEVLAGIDLSALKEQLDQLTDSDDRDEMMADLAAQISGQLQAQTETGQQPAAMNGAPSSQAKAGPLAQARDLLQQVLAKVGSETPEVSGEAPDKSGLPAHGGAGSAVDPRFAGLLGGQKDRPGAVLNPQPRPALSEETEIAVSPDVAAGTTAEVEEAATAAAAKEVANAAGILKSAFESLAQQFQHGQGQPVAALTGAAKSLTGQATIQLPSGHLVAESQIFDQVVTHLSGSVNGESGRMVLRLNPAELGSLKLDLVVEGDEVRANIHAQSQQVQEVLERNLPQLRNALAEQGLKIEQFQVNIDRQQNEGSFDHLAGQQYRHLPNDRSWDYEDVAEEDIIPLAQLMQTAGGGISLHV